jgi:hypothetical protein
MDDPAQHPERDSLSDRRGPRPGDLIAAATYSEAVSLAAMLLSSTSTADTLEHDSAELSALLIGSP